MSKRVLIKDLKEHIGKNVCIEGFIDTIRDQKSIRFIIVRDISGKVQIVQEKKADDVERIVSMLTPESTVEINGKVLAAPQVKLGGIEMIISEIKATSIADTPLPIDEKSSIDLQMDWRVLSMRAPENQLIIKIQTELEKAMRDWWNKNGFLEIHSPKLLSTASESGAELFEVPYFNNTKAYLAQSPQFYKQMAMAAGLEKVFEIGPVFRANPSFTSRQDTEFTSVDVEISYINSFEDIMKFEEEWLAYSIGEVAKNFGAEIKETFGVDVKVPKLPFPRITLEEAREILEKKGHKIDHKADLDPPGERLLSEYIEKEYGHEFVFVTDYPTSVRPFYHMRNPENPEVTESYDLLWKGLEITTGAQREHRYEKLVEQVKEKGLKTAPLENYLNFFRYGCPPHGGCGVGLTRILMIMLNRSNVREVTYIYRGPNRLTP